MAQELDKQQSSGSMSRFRDPFSKMREEMDRVFDSFLGRELFGRPSGISEAGRRAGMGFDLDVRENDKELVFEAELPGIDEKDIQVSVRDGMLSVKGEKKSERDEKKDTYHLVERSYGSFERSFRLPGAADQENIKADFEKGVLRISVPKRAEAVKAEKKIPIGKAGQTGAGT
jgi:HSP20 family protein